MKAPLILLGYSLRRVRTLVAAMALLLAAFQVLLILVAGSIQGSNSFEQLGELYSSISTPTDGAVFTELDVVQRNCFFRVLSSCGNGVAGRTGNRAWHNAHVRNRDWIHGFDPRAAAWRVAG